MFIIRLTFTAGCLFAWRSDTHQTGAVTSSLRRWQCLGSPPIMYIHIMLQWNSDHILVWVGVVRQSKLHYIGVRKVVIRPLVAIQLSHSILYTHSSKKHILVEMCKSMFTFLDECFTL